VSCDPMRCPNLTTLIESGVIYIYFNKTPDGCNL
jgi:hypothetical protein